MLFLNQQKTEKSITMEECVGCEGTDLWAILLQRFFTAVKMTIFSCCFFFYFFHIFAQNIFCGYTLEPPRQGGSNEYPQSRFKSKNMKK